jgi:hypothetical protein
LILNETGYAITVVANKADLNPVTTPHLLEVDKKNENMQLWSINRIPGIGGRYWALSPWAQDGYALAPMNGVCSYDQWIVPMPTWGGPYSLFHAWSIFPYPGTEGV